MSAKPAPGLGLFLAEVRDLADTARQTWRMLARSHAEIGPEKWVTI